MNDQQALKEFCDKVLVICLADSFDREAFKRVRRECYSDVRRSRFGLSNPSAKEVAATIVAILKKRGNAKAEIAALITGKPFFQQIAENDRKRLLEELKQEPETYSAETLKRITSGRSFEAVEEHKGTEIAHEAKEKLADLEKQIKEKKAEFESLPSVLDEPDDSP